LVLGLWAAEELEADLQRPARRSRARSRATWRSRS